MTDFAPPTRVLLMPEYNVGLPLWDRSPRLDALFGTLSAADLGLSAPLARRLEEWNARWEGWAMAAMDFPVDDGSEEARGLEIAIAGHLLAAEVQQELGAGSLVLYPEADSEASQAPRASDSRLGFQASNGEVFSPDPSRARPTPEQEFRAMPDAVFARTIERVDIDALQWSADVRPTRVLLSPRADGLPLRDVTPRIGVPDRALAADALGLSEDLVQRLTAWADDAGAAEVTTLTVPLLVAGHRLAADLSRELGAGVRVLFPEADAGSSSPDALTLLFVERALALREGRPWSPPASEPFPEPRETGMVWSAFPPDDPSDAEPPA